VTETTADIKVSEEGEGRVTPGTGAEIPLQTLVKTMVIMENPTPDRWMCPEGSCTHGESTPGQTPGRSCGL